MSGSVNSTSGAFVVRSTGGLASGATGTVAAGVGAGPTDTVAVVGAKTAARGAGAPGVDGGAMVLGGTDVDVVGLTVLDAAVAAVGTAGATVAAELVGAFEGALVGVGVIAPLSTGWRVVVGPKLAMLEAAGSEVAGAVATAMVERPKRRPEGNPMRAASVMPASA